MARPRPAAQASARSLTSRQYMIGFAPVPCCRSHSAGGKRIRSTSYASRSWPARLRGSAGAGCRARYSGDAYRDQPTSPSFRETRSSSSDGPTRIARSASLRLRSTLRLPLDSSSVSPGCRVWKSASRGAMIRLNPDGVARRIRVLREEVTSRMARAARSMSCSSGTTCSPIAVSARPPALRVMSATPSASSRAFSRRPMVECSNPCARAAPASEPARAAHNKQRRSSQSGSLPTGLPTRTS